jgi:hypothetical protein
MADPGRNPHRTGAAWTLRTVVAAHPATRDLTIQDRLLRYCAALTGVTL